MKLICTVNVINKLHTELNIHNNGKFVKSTLAIGKEPKNKEDYFLIHFSNVNKYGTKYKVKRIKNVLARYVNEGKTTIQFRDPPVELMIRCEVNQLKSFLHLLKLCITGETSNAKLSDLSNISVTTKDYAPKKLEVTNVSQIPDKGLPKSLEILKINDIKMHRFRSEILFLRNLVILDLSNNQISSLPDKLGDLLSLQELYLSNNKLGADKTFNWKWLLGHKFVKSLKLLALNCNSLTYLPPAIWMLESLVTLDLANNHFEILPPALGRLQNLRLLKLSNNKLKSLPCSMLSLRLQSLDISANKFHNNCDIENDNEWTLWEMYVGDLFKIAAKTVLKNRIKYEPGMIPAIIIKMLDQANYCACGNPVFSGNIVQRKFLLKSVFETVIFDDVVFVVPFDCCFCSSACAKMRFR